MKETPSPGIYHDVPADDYHAWDAFNFSSAKHAAKSLLHYRYEKTHPKEQTAAMALGQATHVAVLEPDRFEGLYAQAPKVDRRTKAGKEQWAAFQLENDHKTVLSADDFDLCTAMSEAVWEHPLAAEILKGAGQNEISVVWADDDGLICKCRLDRLTSFDGWTHAVDLKTCKDGSPGGFSKAVGNFDYHMQAAHYLDGLSAHDPRERKFTFIAVENTAPHAVAVYSLSDWCVDQGRDEMEAIRKAVAEARETDVWGGYPNEVVELELPRWRQRTEDLL